jgi:hypothetical protein
MLCKIEKIKNGQIYDTRVHEYKNFCPKRTTAMTCQNTKKKAHNEIPSKEKYL